MSCVFQQSRAMRFLLALTLLCTCALSVSTTVVEVTATTTVTASASGNESGACDNFYGACVVYGGYGSAAYTTTVYAGSATRTVTTTTGQQTSTSLVTSTTTVVQTTTASNSGACDSYDGACVVYGTNGVATTTVYSGSSTNTSKGNGDGEIGESGNAGSEGAIGGAAALGVWTPSSLMAGAAAAAFFGLAFWL